MHRFLWDMHYTPVPKVEPEFPISATYRNTAPTATSPWVAPGDYTATLTIGGKTLTQPLTVAMDPRVKASANELREQFDLSWRLYQLRLKLAPIGEKFDNVVQQLTKLKARAAERTDVTQKLERFTQTLQVFGPPHPRQGAPPSFFVLESTTHLFDDVQGADAAPTAATKAAVGDLETKVGSTLDAWRKLLESDLSALNRELKQAGFPQIRTELGNRAIATVVAAVPAAIPLHATRMHQSKEHAYQRCLPRPLNASDEDDRATHRGGGQIDGHGKTRTAVHRSRRPDQWQCRS